MRIAGIGLAQLLFNAMAILLLCLGAVVLELLGMRFGLYLMIPLLGVQFLVFPALAIKLLQALGLIRGKDMPAEFGYIMVLGFGLLVWLFPGLPLAQDAWRLQQAREVTAQSVDAVLRHGEEPMLFHLPGFAPDSHLRGQHVRRSRSDNGTVSRTYYSAVLLLPPGADSDRRLWLGWKDRSADPTIATRFRVNPWNTDNYRRALENALGTEPAGEILILERSLPLEQARAEAWDWLRFSFWLANGISLGLLVAMSIAIAVIRWRRG